MSLVGFGRAADGCRSDGVLKRAMIVIVIMTSDQENPGHQSCIITPGTGPRADADGSFIPFRCPCRIVPSVEAQCAGKGREGGNVQTLVSHLFYSLVRCGLAWDNRGTVLEHPRADLFSYPGF